MSDKALRDIYGETLAEIGKANEKVVVLDADVSGSTKSCIFGQKYPERFYNVGIAESNMISMAAGFAAYGKTPVANTFAVFMSTIGLCPLREMISYDNLNVKLVGTYGGMSNAFDGATHHANEDLAIMRVLPNLSVIVFSDPIQTKALVREAICNHIGPVYLRSSRQAPPQIYKDDTAFSIGKGAIIKDGKDITVIACGMMVHEAIKAANELEKDQISVRVVDMYSVKPIDRDLILKCVKETKRIITIEEHNIHGGLGGAVSEVLAENGTNISFHRMGIKDVHTQSGDYQDLLRKFGLDAQSIIDQIKNVNE